MGDGKVMINILYEDNHLLVVEKPINVPVQADSSHDLDLLTMLKNYLKEKYKKPGNVYLGLVHRLDRPVSGIMVFAKTSKAAGRLSKQLREGTFHKTYIAVVCGEIEKQGVLKDNFLVNIKNNFVKIDKNGKPAILEYSLLEKKDNLNLVRINLLTGRKHQIRVQFASRNNPLYGDQRYNKNVKIREQIALFSSEISFMHPTLNKEMNFKLPLPQRYPFSIFR